MLGISVIARKQLNEDIGQMLALATASVETNFLTFEHRDEGELEQVQKREGEIDLCNARLSRRVSRVLAVEDSPSEINTFNHMSSIIGNVEHISDHVTNTAGYARTMMERGLELSPQASVELADIRTSCTGAVHLIYNACIAESKPRPEQGSLLEQALLLEQGIDRRTARHHSDQVERMRRGKCHVETSILYSGILADYERIGNHAFSIAQALDKLDEN